VRLIAKRQVEEIYLYFFVRNTKRLKDPKIQISNHKEAVFERNKIILSDTTGGIPSFWKTFQELDSEIKLN
jgi:hypothetical protein